MIGVMKKSQGLSLNFMAVAVLILVVILIVIGIFRGAMGDVVPFLSEQKECKARGGECDTSECKIKGGTPILGLGCSGTTEYCCIKGD